MLLKWVFSFPFLVLSLLECCRSQLTFCVFLKAKIWEPAGNKRNAIAAASEAACVILSIDETVRNPQSEQAQMEARREGGGDAPVSEALGGAGLKGMAQGMPGMSTLKGKGGR